MHTLKDAPKFGRINLWDATTVGENVVARRRLPLPKVGQDRNGKIA